MPRPAAYAILLAILCLPAAASGHGREPAVPPADSIDASAQPAAAVVDAFSAALRSLDVANAGKLLAEDALVLESGNGEHSRAEYLATHAGADAMFLQQATVRRLRRVARCLGNLAWVATESEVSTQREGKPVALRSTETMVLLRTPAGWRIVHIHWSSARTPAP